jgi:nicotinamide mononucleotide (NMN) deamidase PncC
MVERKKKPIGLVYVAIKINKKIYLNKFNFKNKGRSYIQKNTVTKIIRFINKII